MLDFSQKPRVSLETRPESPSTRDPRGRRPNKHLHVFHRSPPAVATRNSALSIATSLAFHYTKLYHLNTIKCYTSNWLRAPPISNPRALLHTKGTKKIGHIPAHTFAVCTCLCGHEMHCQGYDPWPKPEECAGNRQRARALCARLSGGPHSACMHTLVRE